MNLYEAIRDNNAKKVKSILSKNRHVANISRAYGSPLLIAAEGGYIDIIKVLLKYGADPNSIDSNGWTPLISACHFNHYDAVIVFLENNANPNIRCHFGNTALHAAARNDNVRIMQALLDCGAEIDVTNADGCTPLHRAACSNRINAAKFLLEKGANASIKSTSGRTPYDTAVHMRLYDLAHLLRKYHRRQTELEGDENTETDFNNNVNVKPERSRYKGSASFKSFVRRLGLLKREKTLDENDMIDPDESTITCNRKSTLDDSDEEDEGTKNECPICFEIPLPPTQIYQCTNGHIYCEKCKRKPNMHKCPQCGIDISGVENRNRYAEENIAELCKMRKM